ncbi:MAG: RagB/SusD family nutrient uptake outer membrane protein [Candidatus Cryptobacteroides sp.]
MKKRTIISSLAIATLCLSLFNACTKNFEEWNTNQHEATKEQMSQDNLFTGALFRQMQRNVIIFADGNLLDSDYQITYNLNADMFSGYLAPTNAFSTNGNHSGTYNLQKNWLRPMFNYKYNGTMSAYGTLKEKATELGQLEVIAVADIVKVLSMQQVTDYYGPVPYSKVGESINAIYDSQEDIYKTMFAELDNAIDLLTEYFYAGNSNILTEFDYVYGGDVLSWIKLANTLRLRLAIRVVYADAALAQLEAEKSIAHPAGVMTAATDKAAVQHSKVTYHHPIWEIANNFNDGDTHMGASMDSYMNGYNDPRRASYWQKANDGQYHGVRLGIVTSVWTPYGNEANNVSLPNITNATELVWMTASEAWFLRAEGAIRGWAMGADAETCYNNGIRVSFEEAAASNVEAYLADDISVPADFVDNAGNNGTAALGTVTIKWDESADFETKLEKIITQKWIAIFPNGCEAWAEFRRTGYPKLFPVLQNNSNGLIDTDIQIRRLPYPETEYTNNAEEVAKGVALLGGADNGGTRLWWDQK